MGSRRQARECALKLLFQNEFTVLDTAIYNYFWETEQVLPEAKEFAEKLYNGVQKNSESIDAIVKECTLNWDMERISLVDLNILRMSIFEIQYIEEIPVAVSINEAIDIAKRFSTIESGKFVNGILDKAKVMIEDKSKIEDQKTKIKRQSPKTKS